MGVADDFSIFRNKYNIDSETISSISYRYRRITRQLNYDFWGSSSETEHSLYVGSYGRDTAARGLSDLDIGFILPSSVYTQYNLYIGNGQSALLQAVKRSIQKTYSTSESFGDGQVVVINFQDGITFEVLPAFMNKDGISWTYPNANNGGGWKVCNPRSEINAVKIRNNSCNKNLKYLCRMMRVWKKFHSVPMSGMLIDTLAYQFIETWAHKDKSFLYHDYMARDFFLYLSRIPSSQQFWRAPGSGSHVAKTGNFQSKAKLAYDISLTAIKFNEDKYEWSRRQSWRQIFGTLFPS